MNTTPSPPELLGIKKAAAAIGMSERWLWSRIAERALPSIRLGNRVLIDASDLRAFVEKRKTAARD